MAAQAHGEPGSAESAGDTGTGAGANDLAATGRLVDQVAVAVAGCPTVARLATGPSSTYLPHRTVPGVVLYDDRVEVSVVARYGSRMSEIADQVREAVRPIVPGRRVDVAIEDIEPPAPWVVWGIDSRVP